MKQTVTILALAALITGTSHAAITGKSSGFMDKCQLASWRAETGSKSAEAKQENPAFFTGKPYLVVSDTYAFKFRNYEPTDGRWTSEDPSGFPDGANNLLYVNNRCIAGIDSEGLAFLAYRGGNLEQWSGSGWVSDTEVNWGEMEQQWGAVSGPHGNGAIPNGWYSVGSTSQLLGYHDPVSGTSERDYQDASGTWQQGAMSQWHGDGRDAGHTQYKFALNPIHNTNVGGRTGFKIHPDGNNPGTAGCVGIPSFENAVNVFQYINGREGLTLLVE